MNIHIGTIIKKMEETLEQLKAESCALQPSQQRIQEHAIALRSYADLLYSGTKTTKSSGHVSPRLGQTPSIQHEGVAPTIPTSDGGSLLDF